MVQQKLCKVCDRGEIMDGANPWTDTGWGSDYFPLFAINEVTSEIFVPNFTFLGEDKSGWDQKRAVGLIRSLGQMTSE